MLDNRYCGDWQPSPRWQATAYAKRRGFFEAHPEHCNNLVPCPACGYPTLERRNSYEYCSLCGWEDDGQDDPYAHEYWGGPNGRLTLDQARLNFEVTGCLYSEADHELLPLEAAVAFDPRVLKAKKRLCRAYEALMTLSSPAAIRAQWEEIDALWRAWRDTEKQVRKQVEQAMRRKTPKGGSR